MTHECIIQSDRDVFSTVEQYMVRCRCHMDSWKIWRPGDPVPQCSEGTPLTVNQDGVPA